MYIGIDIGGTKCAVTASDDSGNIVEKIRFDTLGCQATLQTIFEAVASLGQAKAIGISCGGPLDTKRGIIMSPPNLPGWDNIPIVDMLKDRFCVPVYIENDANACALAEWKFGAGRGTASMVFLTFGTGMGSGLILDGRLYRGISGNAGEIGHMRMAPSGPVGFGKAGSFEGFCSGGGIRQLGIQKAKELFAAGKSASFCPSPDRIETINAKSIAEQADMGQCDAMEVYETCGRMLGRGLAVLVDVLNPEAIVMGSIFARSSHLLQASMEEELKKECLPESLTACRILPAALGEQIGDYGALTVAMSGGN